MLTLILLIKLKRLKDSTNHEAGHEYIELGEVRRLRGTSDEHNSQSGGASIRTTRLNGNHQLKKQHSTSNTECEMLSGSENSLVIEDKGYIDWGEATLLKERMRREEVAINGGQREAEGGWKELGAGRRETETDSMQDPEAGYIKMRTLTRHQNSELRASINELDLTLEHPLRESVDEEAGYIKMGRHKFGSVGQGACKLGQWIQGSFGE